MVAAGMVAGGGATIVAAVVAVAPFGGDGSAGGDGGGGVRGRCVYLSKGGGRIPGAEVPMCVSATSLAMNN